MSKVIQDRDWFTNIFTPDLNRDGNLSWIEATRFFLGRLAFVASVGLVAWTLAGFLATLFNGLFSPLGWFLAFVAGAVGLFLGAVLGIIAPYMEGFGFWLAGRERGTIGKLRVFTFTLFCIGITVGTQLLLGSDLIAADREKLLQAERQDAAVLERADAMRGTESLQDQLAIATQAEQRAATRVETVQNWQQLVITCAGEGGGPCEYVKPVQVALGLNDDGMVRGNVAGCENCGQTTNAINAELETARAALTAATAERQRVFALKEAADSAISSGAVAEVEMTAREAAETRSLVKMFRQAAYMIFKARNDPRQDDQAAIDEFSKTLSEFFVYAVVLLLNAANFGLNNTGPARDEDEPLEARQVEYAPVPPPAPVEPAAQPSPTGPSDADLEREKRLADKEAALEARDKAAREREDRALAMLEKTAESNSQAYERALATSSDPLGVAQPGTSGFNNGKGPRRTPDEEAYSAIDALNAKISRAEEQGE